MGSPRVVLLSGGSSAGKTTVARALLDLLDPPAVLVEADRAFPLLSSSTSGCPVAPIVVFHRSLTTWLSAGFILVVDGSLPYGDHELRHQCLAELPSGQTFIIGVACSSAELRRRERLRSDQRLVGWAEHQADDVNAGLPLLTSVDTSTGTTLEHASAVVRALDDAAGAADVGQRHLGVPPQ